MMVATFGSLLIPICSSLFLPLTPFTLPYLCPDRYYYYFNSGLQQQYVLFTQNSLDAPATVLLDPNTMSDDGTVSLKVEGSNWIILSNKER